MRSIILSPIITEKSMGFAGGGKYSFLVSRFTSKTTIKQAIAGKFKVSIVNVQTVVIKGKRKRIGVRRVEVVESELKKAIVTLKKGQKIGLFEPGGADYGEEILEPEKEKKENKKANEDKTKKEVKEKKGKEKKLKV